MIEVFDLSRATDLDKQKLPIKTINGVSPDSAGNIDVRDMTVRATNPITDVASDTVAQWGALGPGVYWFTLDGTVTDKPTEYGYLINYSLGQEIFQLWKGAPVGDVYQRGGNPTGGWNSNTWKKLGGSAAITETWRSGSSWYRKWSDGWIEQGGEITSFTNRRTSYAVPQSSEQTITHQTAFSSTNYQMFFCLTTTLSCVLVTGNVVQRMTSSTGARFDISQNVDGTNTVTGRWYACGY